MRALMTVGLGLAFGIGVLMAQGPAPAAPAAPAVPTVVKVGDMAPDFSLQGTDGKTHKLSEYRGKTAVVVAWFPKAFTGGCTIECKSLAETATRSRSTTSTYFMASTDPIEENTKFAKATSVTLSGRDGGEDGRREEGSRLPDAVGSDDGDGARLRRGDRRAHDRAAVDVLHRQVRKIAAIDTAVRPATSAEDMIAKLSELKVPTKS